ncbi:MAG: GrpE protein [Lachnospiraceae bacterium]|nr:GrpE protein [Lachnospiraceae bacterium]
MEDINDVLKEDASVEDISDLDKDLQSAEINAESEDIEAYDDTNSENETVNEDDDVMEDNEPATGEEGKSGKSFFKKKEKKEKKDAKDLKIEELNDRLIRNMAEFDNFRKRSEKEKTQMFEIGAKSIIEKVLPVIDNFERGLGTLTEEEKEGAFAQGIEKIYKQLVTSLEEAGLQQIEAAGQTFDPNYHNAVMHAEDSELGENIVAEVFQKGYTYKSTVVRHSMVKVVN